MYGHVAETGGWGFTEWTILVVGVTVVLAWLSTMLVITENYTRRFIQQFGRQVAIKQPGLSFKQPWPFQNVAGYISTAVKYFERVVQIITSDRAILTAKVIVQYEAISDEGDAALELAFYKLTNPEQQIGGYIENEAKSACTGMDMNKLFESKDDIERAIVESLRERFAGFGYRVVNAQMIEPEPSDALKKAFDDVLSSEQRKRAAINDAEARKTLMVGEAQAESESVAIKVETFRTKRKAIAETIVGITELLAPTGISPERALAYLEGIDWRDAIRDASANPGSTILLPANYGGSMSGAEIDPAKLVGLIKALAEKEQGA